jgi:hypothetical protein
MSEKIAKIEEQLTRGLITSDEFCSEVDLVVSRVVRQLSLKKGEVWRAKDKYGNFQSFLVGEVSYQDHLVLWRLDESPSHCSMDYWTNNKGYTGWTKTLSSTGTLAA